MMRYSLAALLSSVCSLIVAGAYGSAYAGGRVHKNIIFSPNLQTCHATQNIAGLPGNIGCQHPSQIHPSSIGQPILPKPGAIIAQPSAIIAQPSAIIAQPNAIIAQPGVIAPAGQMMAGQIVQPNLVQPNPVIPGSVTGHQATQMPAIARPSNNPYFPYLKRPGVEGPGAGVDMGQVSPIFLGAPNVQNNVMSTQTGATSTVSGVAGVPNIAGNVMPGSLAQQGVITTPQIPVPNQQHVSKSAGLEGYPSLGSAQVSKSGNTLHTPQISKSQKLFPVPAQAAMMRQNFFSGYYNSGQMSGTQGQSMQMSSQDGASNNSGVIYNNFIFSPFIESAMLYDNVDQGGTDSSYTSLVLETGLTGQSNWERHGLSFSISGLYQQDIDSDDELNRPLSFDIGLFGQINVSEQTIISINSSYEVDEADATDPSLELNPTKLPYAHDLNVSASLAHRFDRLVAVFTSGVQSNFYGDYEVASGSNATLEMLDSTEFDQSLRFQFDLNEQMRPFVEGGYQWRNYDNAETNKIREADGYNFKGGMNFSLNEYISGEATIGYRSESYADGSLADLEGITFDGAMTYRGEGGSEFSISAESDTKDVLVKGASGATINSFGMQYSHQLNEHINMTVGTDYALESYEGMDREDTVLGLYLSGQYSVTDQFYINAYYDFENRDSDEKANQSTKNAVKIGLRYSY